MRTPCLCCNRVVICAEALRLVAGKQLGRAANLHARDVDGMFKVFLIPVVSRR